jgi:predicted transcriptional regulator
MVNRRINQHRKATRNHMPQLKLTADILSAALEGFESQKNRIDAQIAEIRTMLDGRNTAQLTASESTAPKRRVSAAVRRRMAGAQRLRLEKDQASGRSEG